MYTYTFEQSNIDSIDYLSNNRNDNQSFLKLKKLILFRVVHSYKFLKFPKLIFYN